MLGLATALVARRGARQRVRAASAREEGRRLHLRGHREEPGKRGPGPPVPVPTRARRTLRRGQDRPARRRAPKSPSRAPPSSRPRVEAVDDALFRRRPSRPRNSKLAARPRGGAVVALVLTVRFLEYLIIVRTKALALEKSLEALVVAVAAPATDARSARAPGRRPRPPAHRPTTWRSRPRRPVRTAAAPACAKACQWSARRRRRPRSAAPAGGGPVPHRRVRGVSARRRRLQARLRDQGRRASVDDGGRGRSALDQLARARRFLVNWNADLQAARTAPSSIRRRISSSTMLRPVPPDCVLLAHSVAFHSICRTATHCHCTASRLRRCCPACRSRIGAAPSRACATCITRVAQLIICFRVARLYFSARVVIRPRASSRRPTLLAHIPRIWRNCAIAPRERSTRSRAETLSSARR